MSSRRLTSSVSSIARRAVSPRLTPTAMLYTKARAGSPSPATGVTGVSVSGVGDRFAK